MRKLIAFLFLPVSFLLSCKHRQPADQIFYNGNIYTVDSEFSVTQAFAIGQGKILKCGSTKEIMEEFYSGQKINLNGKTVLPGLNDAHTHFYHYCYGLEEIDLTGTKSFGEVLHKVTAYAAQHPKGWLIGRGWDQNDWVVKEYPDNHILDSLFPERPVFLSRIDGHGALVNTAALNLAGITGDTLVEGGKFIRKKIKNRTILTGLLIDNAVDLIKKAIPDPTFESVSKALIKGQQNCLKAGLTSLAEAGMKKKEIEFLQKFGKSGKLKLKIYVMLEANSENIKHYLPSGIIVDPLITIRSVKFYADGALGSRGALLKKPYADAQKEYGLLLTPVDSLRKMAELCSKAGFQINTHAIGDSAVAIVLDIYRTAHSNIADKRWRIEHAQVVDEKDVEQFSALKIIPSMQPTHATSDMYWASKRLGNSRLPNAYCLRKLKNQNGFIALGSDFPVEDINPFHGIYAAVTRQDKKQIPAGGFIPDQSLSREEALRGFTIWAARAAFEDHFKGSLEKGKVADFIVIDRDIMHCDAYQIWQTSVIETYINGELVYKRNR